MDCSIIKRLPCSVCGLSTFRREGWFLVMENRWLDHLKILSWHPSLASDKDVRNACCREHLKLMVSYWLEEASLRLDGPVRTLAVPLAGCPDQLDLDLTPDSEARVIGELSVYREPFSRSWAGSPEALECILEALVPSQNASRPAPAEFRHSDPQPASRPGLVLY